MKTNNKENKENMKPKTFEERFKELEAFCQKNGRFPSYTIEEENPLCRFAYKNYYREEIKKLRSQFKRSAKFCTNLAKLKLYCIENSRLPKYNPKDPEETYLRKFYDKNKNRKELNNFRKIYLPDFSDLVSFCEEYNRLPTNKDDARERCLYHLYYINRDKKEYIDLYDKYCYCNRKPKNHYSMRDVEVFCEKHNRLPNCKVPEERPLYDIFYKNRGRERMKKLHSTYCRQQKVREKHSIEELKTFCENNNRLPSAKIPEEKPLYDFLYGNRNKEEFRDVYERYRKRLINEKIQEFFNEYGRLPKESSTIKEERILGEELREDPNRALKGAKILAPLVMKDFEQFSVAQQYEIMSIFGIPISFMDEACTRRKKRATLEAIKQVFKNHGAELEVKEERVEKKDSKSLTQVDQIKRFSSFMSEYNADPHSPYLINESLNNLWDTIIIESKHNSKKTYNELMSDSETTEFFNIIRTKVAEEYKKAKEYKPSDEYSNRWDPDLMQRLCIIRLREKKYYANWSKTGTGKTLQSLLSSLDIDAKITVYVLPNSTIADKAGTGIESNIGAIREFIPKSNVIIYKGKSSLAGIDETKRNYILVNYEKLSRHRFLKGLENLAESGKIDFICIDEVQMAKSRGDKIASNRSKALLAFRRLAQDHNPNLYVLGLTATPVINNLYEVKTLCEIITGKQLGDDKLFTENSISFASAQTAHKYLVNYGFRYNHDYSSEITENEQIIPINGGSEIYNEINKINDKFKNLGKSRRGMAGIKELEESLIIPKLESCKHLIKPGVVLYIQYVGHTIEIINKWLQKNGIGYVLYTGTGAELTEDEETGEMIKIRDEELKKFIGDSKKGIQGSHIAKILIASSVLRTGVDGLQKVSNTIIMLNLPWTYADYEQLKGRLIRKNSVFNKVNIYIPMISLKLKSGEWSWDRAKWEILQYKKDLSDLIIYGDYVNSNILKIAQNETESSLIEKILRRLDSPLEFYSEETHPDVNYEEVRKKLGSHRPYKKPKYSCIVYLHQRINKLTTQEIEEDNNEPGRWRQMYDYWVDQDSIIHKRGYVDPNVETANLINDIYGGPDKKVADLGCGIHDPLRKLVTNCGEFFSCTFEPKEIELPEGVVRCDSTRLTMVEDKYFDIANHTNSHWGTNLEDYVREDYRILKDDGILIITSVCPSRRNKYKIIAKAYLDSGLWEYEREPIRFGGKSGMMRGIFRKKRV